MAIVVKFVPSVDRWILNPVALAALFVHFRLICVPETAVAHDHAGLRQMRIARMPPRRLAVVTARGVQLSLADQAVHDAVRRIVRDERRPTAERSA